MSCIQLPPAHIAALVRFAVDYPHWPTVHGSPIKYRTASGDWEPITSENAPAIAAELAQANANAYAERYRETPQPVTVYTTSARRVRTLTAVEAIKAAHSFRYQSSDWTGYEDSTAARIIEAIIDSAARIVAGYRDADTWAIGDEPAPVTLRYTRVQMDADNAEARLFAAIHD